MTNVRTQRAAGKNAITLRPFIIGVLAASAVTLLILGATSLTFSIMKSIVDSAVVPLALIAAGTGCFVGAYICACMVGRRGMVCGAIVGTVAFFILWLLSVVFTKEIFDTENAVKAVIVVMCGSFGGYLGGKRRRVKR